jgi:mono/diheme cytochrome c family protein
MKNLVFTALAATVAVGIVYADQSQAGSKTVVPMSQTSASSGKQMFTSYCASCHGVDGKGNGPVAGSLKKQPADLTVLSKNNGGKFPSEHVMAVLEFGAKEGAHGTSQMPVWGPALSKIDASQSHLGTLRMSNLTKYIESIQVKMK